MNRTFIYARVSTVDQSPSNQILEVEAAGFTVNQHRIVVECVRGSVEANARPKLTELISQLAANDTLIVTQLDQLGRDTMYFLSTVECLACKSVRVYCLALGAITALKRGSG